MKNGKLGFLALESRYVIAGVLLPQGALHVGSGAAGEDTDATFMRDANGPFVPGSSLRGVMRSTIERILQGLDRGGGCVLFAEETHRTCFTVNQSLWKTFEACLANAKPEQREGLLLDKLLLGDGLCDICRLFGSPWLASKLRISDSRPISTPQMEKRDGVGIDRDTDTAKEKIKYDFEALERSTAFSFHIQVENATPIDLSLLHILLTEMQQLGIHVGGKKARGLGHVKLKPEYQVSYFDNSREYKLENFLVSGKLDPMGAPAFVKMSGACLGRYLAREEKHATPIGE